MTDYLVQRLRTEADEWDEPSFDFEIDMRGLLHEAAAEIERLREALEIWIFHHQRAMGEKPDVARQYAKAWMFRNANGEEPE